MAPTTPCLGSSSSHSLTVLALILCRLKGLEECWIARSPFLENGWPRRRRQSRRRGAHRRRAPGPSAPGKRHARTVGHPDPTDRKPTSATKETRSRDASLDAAMSIHERGSEPPLTN